jgi:hypothetical protein
MELLLLFAVQILSIWKNRVSSTYKPNRNSLIILFAMSFFTPLLEEALFRVVYKQYFGDSFLARVLNALLFGIVHSSNALFLDNKSNVFVQVLTTSYLGYYIFSFNTFLEYAGVHIFYNLINMSAIMFLPRGKPTPEMKPVYLDAFSDPSILIPKRSLDDCDLIFRRKPYQSCPRSKIDPKIFELREKFSQKILFRNSKQISLN